MSSDFELLAEKESMWAEMLMQVLKDNDIPCTAVPVFGAGLSLRAGVKERLKIYVPSESAPKAADILHELFPGGEARSSPEE